MPFKSINLLLLILILSGERGSGISVRAARHDDDDDDCRSIDSE